MDRLRRTSGFTLAELLVALAILGLIAVFTVPKVLQSQQNSQYRSIGKQAATMVAYAYAQYQMGASPGVNTRISDLTPYMNFVKLETTGTLDRRFGYATPTWGCDNTAPCLLLHNGARMAYYVDTGAAGMGNRFGGTASTNYIYFVLDPDGKVSSSPATTNGPGKGADFALYFGGTVRLLNECQTGDITYENGSIRNWCPIADAVPDWFSW